MTRLASMYLRLYAAVCGTPPQLRPWHSQWLAVRELSRNLRGELPALSGSLLDVGCGEKPYRRWLPGVTDHVGLDVVGGPHVDHVVEPGAVWPLPDAYFDAVLCTQVLEHAEDPDHVLSEIGRVLRPGGVLVLSLPFIYNEHGAPHDYRRFSAHGVRLLLRDGYEDLRLKTEGGIGSTMAVLALNWIDAQMTRSRGLRLAKGALFPLWLLVSLAVNLAGVVIDRLDTTGGFYNNVFVVARRHGRVADQRVVRSGG